MDVRIRGSRGSVPSPGAERLRYGGDTSCVQVALSDGKNLILDAGTGIRNVPQQLAAEGEHLHILLTHLHLDHISGLLFFAPLFDPRAEVTVWGPPHPSEDLRKRLARYLSTPLSPVEIRDLPANVCFRSCEPDGWRIGDAMITAEPVIHRTTALQIFTHFRWIHVVGAFIDVHESGFCTRL